MDSEQTKAMALNAISMLVAECTENGYQRAELLGRIDATAQFAGLSAAERRAAEVVGWEEGVLCGLTDGRIPFDLDAAHAVADLLTLSAEEIQRTTVADRLAQIGYPREEATPVSKLEIEPVEA